MNQLSVGSLIRKRLVEDWRLLISVFAGFMIVSTISAGAPVYVGSLEELAFNNAVDRITTPFLNIHIFARSVSLTERSLREVEDALDRAIEGNIAEIALGRERYLRGSTELVGRPTQPLPDRPGTGELVSRGYFQNITGLAERAMFLEGVMPGSEIGSGPRGPILEALIVQETADRFDLGKGDSLSLAPDLQTFGRVTVNIVGVVEPDDPDSEYWRTAGVLLTPSALDNELPPLGVEVDSDEPGIPLFVAEEIIIPVLSLGGTSTVVDPVWFVLVDKEGIKDWSIAEAKRRLDGFDDSVHDAVPGSTVTTAVVRGLIDDIETRAFFSKVPILLLLAVLLVTIFFYLTMMVSYLVQSRERDAALLKSRGVSSLQILRLHALEGLMMAVVAMLTAPFLAIGSVAVAGLMPYFRAMTGGNLLPVDVTATPFIVSAGATLVCLAIFIASGALGTRSGLLIHKLRTSRPPMVPLFQRYYLDVAFVVLGGLVFWELRSRGQLVSGGLFKNVEVNEALLMAPVLFLIAVALVFLRFFPLVVRYISGESAVLVHLVVGVSVVGLGGSIVYRETGGNIIFGASWLGPVALLVALAVVYRATDRARSRAGLVAGLVLQAASVGAFLRLEPLDAGEALFFPTLALISVVPAQVLFPLLKASTKRMPVWLSMGLWRMTRNPLQYTWLVLLLVLATGLAILSTTVGGTLARSQEDRLLFDLATDIRIKGVPASLRGGMLGLKQGYLDLPAVQFASMAYRTSGSFGSENLQVLGLESGEVPLLSWYYREDFSDISLNGVMRALQSDVIVEPATIPEGAKSIGLWVRPDQFFLNLPIWAIIEDKVGRLTTVSLGSMGGPEWHLLEGEIPDRLEHPLSLVSVQVLEVGYGLGALTGTMLLDDIHVLGPEGEKYLLEGFENVSTRWLPIITSNLPTDSIISTAEDAVEGNRAGRFSFGRDTILGIRGIYLSATRGPIPVVVSSSVLERTGVEVGDYIIAQVSARPVPLLITGSVEYFPTIKDNESFVLADLYYLMSYINLIGSPSSNPNELYIKRVDGILDPLPQVVEDNQQALFIKTEDLAERLEALRLDPLSSASFGALVLIVLAIVLGATTTGYVTYLLLFAYRTRIELGFLQTLGLSTRQMVGLLGFEHFAVVAMGIALGTWAGLQMSRLMVSPLAVTEMGEPVLPPFVLMTDWSLMLPTYLALIGIFVVALVVLNRSIGHADLQTIARLGES